jgi:hypothetical protein|tara:strand:+ start:865 stop:2586 length:1722 start_codon:yes stop_codon:yes gene_type:complete
MTVNNTDTFLVERSGTSYKLQAQNLMADLQDTDLMLVERSGTSYKATGLDVKNSLGSDQPTFKANADGAISVGDPVVLNDNGTVSAVSSTSYSESAATGGTMTGGLSSEEPISIVYDPTNNRLFALKVGSNDRNIRVRIGTFSGQTKTVTWGSWTHVFTTQRNPWGTNSPPGLYWDDDNQQLILGIYTQGFSSGQYQNVFVTLPVSSNGTFSSNPSDYQVSAYGNTTPDAQSNPITFLKPTVANTIHAGFAWVSSSNKRYEIITFTVGSNSLTFRQQTNVQSSAQDCSCAISSKDNTILVTSAKNASTVDARFFRTKANGLGIDLISGTTGNIIPTYSTWGTRHHKAVYDEIQDAFWFVCQSLQNIGNTAHDLWTVLVPANADVPAKKGNTQQSIDTATQYYTIDYWAPGRKLIINVAGGDTNQNATKLRWYSLEWSGSSITKSNVWRGINGTTDTGADRINSWAYVPHQGQMVSYYSQWSSYSSRYSAWWNPAYTSTTLKTDNYLGMADSSASSGAEAKVIVFPGVQANQTGLSTGNKYYVQIDGTLATSADSIPAVAGVAQSATSIKVQYS